MQIFYGKNAKEAVPCSRWRRKAPIGDNANHRSYIIGTYMLTDILEIAPEVAAALASNEPVVALESTVIAHGLPRPQNLTTALRLQEIVHDAGAVPATVAILQGKLRVGLSNNELRQLAVTNEIRKISTRDLPIAVAQNLNGATTVATTTRIAHRAGIRVFEI